MVFVQLTCPSYKTECEEQNGVWIDALDKDDTTTHDSEYSITTDYMVPNVQTLSESYVITYSLAMQYVRRVRDNAFGGTNSVIKKENGAQAYGGAGQIKYCQDQEFTATIRRDASASVVVAQVKAAELNRAVVVEDIRWIGSSEAAIPGIWGCNQGEYRVEVTFMVMDQDARYQDLGWSVNGVGGALEYWEPADLTEAMVDTAADAQNPNSMAIKTLVYGIDTVTILRKPGYRCFFTATDELCTTAECRDPAGNHELQLCETQTCQNTCLQATDKYLSDQDVAADRLLRNDDNYHFKVMGQCVPITQCLTNAEDAETPIEEVPDGINGNSWADYSQQFIFDLVVRGKFLKSDVDTKIEVTSNFQECPVTAAASVTGVPRIGVQLECFEPVSFEESAIQWVTKVTTSVATSDYASEGITDGDPANSAQECIECHRLPRSYIDIKGITAESHVEHGLYTLSSQAPSTGFCTDNVQTSETACESSANDNCGTVAEGAAKGHCKWIDTSGGINPVCCPMDCAAAYADDLAQTRAKVFVTDALDSDLTETAYTIAVTQEWVIESSEIFIERYDTSTVTATTGATLIGEVRLCVCPDPENPSLCKVDNSNPYGLGSFNTHSTVTRYCKNAAGDPLPQYKTSAECTGGDNQGSGKVWDEGIEEYFMICGEHTNVESDQDNYGKEAGVDNVFDSVTFRQTNHVDLNLIRLKLI